MELDVHLKKNEEESWGFRLVGGKDLAMPLTVIMVVPESPAALAGLLNGDVVGRINDERAGDMSLDDAKRCVAGGSDLILGVKRGLYDPVLDDYDPIYEPIDQEDFDQPSQPTEVDPFKIEQFFDPSVTPEGHYLDPKAAPARLSELRDIETPCFNGTPGPNGLDLSRSHTASPFVLLTKPYRPFSTEPVPENMIPPLEHPIILNPNYKDNFENLGSGGDDELLPETRFKLPISEQYDPDGTKKKKKEGSVVKEVKFVEDASLKTKKDESVVQVKCIDAMKKAVVEEKQFMEKMKMDIDLENIEMTAVSVVDESIERAVSVTDEIKKEIDVELRESSIVSSKVEESKSVKESLRVISEVSTSESIKETAKSVTSNKVSKEACELVDLINKTTEKIITYNGHEEEVSVAKEVEKFESHDKKEQIVDERRLSTKQEIEEIIEVGSVRRKSEVFDKKVQATSESIETSGKKTAAVTENVKISAQSVKDEKIVARVEDDIIEREEAETKLASVKDTQKKAVKAEAVNLTAQKTSEIKKDSESYQKTDVKSTATRAKLQSDHTKAYIIGLQTIPNIKGTITAYHYHLLLKTFFIHLTDVMVALSRFILTESAFSKAEEQQNIVQESVSEYKERYTDKEKIVDKKHDVVERKQSVVKETKAFESKKDEVEIKQEIKKINKVIDVADKVVDRKEEKSVVKARVVEKVLDHKEDIKSAAQEVVVEAIDERRHRDEIQENLEVEQIMERKEKLSGAQMAQKQERKSAELTQKMDLVITEFQNKAGIEESEITREKRSRSRSKVEEEVSLASDPLDWLAKKEIEQKEITEMKTESKSFSSLTESTEKKRVEKHETREKTSKSKEGKQMYVAIVESHVFTNKDAIFEEQAVDFSETSSVVSAEETNIAVQASETVATEQVSLESKEMHKEVAETVLEESRELSIVNAQTEAVVQKVEELQTSTVVEEFKAIVEEVKEEKAVEKDTKLVQEVVIQEVTEPLAEVQDMKKVEIKEDYQQLCIKEEQHVMSVSEKSEVKMVESHNSIAVEEAKREEYAAVSVQESKAIEIVKEEIKEEVKAAEIIKEEKKIEEVVKEEIKAAVKKETKAELVKQEIKRVEYKPPPIQEVNVELRVVQRARSKSPSYQEESAALTIVKPARTPTDEKQEIIFTEQTDVTIRKNTEMQSDGVSAKSKMESCESTEIQGFTFKSSESESKVAHASFTAKSSTQDSTASLTDQKRSLKLDLEKRRQSEDSEYSVPSTISTPTPGTVPPTPVTDNYVFKLKAKMPKEDGTPIPRDCTPTPEDEDPNIVKKKLIPYIDTTIESPIIYDPPLPSPPVDKVGSPVYSKPGLKGGSYKQEFRKEEILEIERKSSLLASAIDETIKSIEEYKEEVGIDTKKDIVVDETSKFEKSSSKTVKQHSNTEVIIKSSETQPIIYNGYAKVETKVYNTVNRDIEEEWNKIDKKVKESNDELTELSNNIDVEVDVTLKVNSNSEVEPKLVEKVLTETYKKENIEETATLDNENPTSSEVATPEVQKQKPEDTSAVFTIKTIMPSLKDVESTEAIKTIDIVQEKAVTERDEKKMNGVSEEVALKTDYNKESLTNGTEMSNGDIPKAVIEQPPPMFAVEEKKDPMAGYRPIQFDPEEIKATKRGLQSIHLSVQPNFQRAQSPSYVDSEGELLGTHQGIVDGLEEAVVDEDIAKELGKPGLTEQKIAELISGESEMLREAHVMGLSRVLKSHMHRADDDSSVDFKKIKPILQSLKDSEVLKALNEEIERAREEKRKEEEKKWTTFMQKPKRPVPRAKFGYPGWVQEEENVEAPYKVKIVKQPKPKVAPDYKPKNFETGPLPWEERALNEPPAPPVEAEEPILVPEDLPEFLEAVDPLPESEVPDLEDTGIPLPPPKPVEEESSPSPAPVEEEKVEPEESAEELDLEAVVEETEKIVEEMEQNRLAEQLLMGVQSMVDPNASVEQQLAQMRAQMAALAQLPSVIQQTLDVVSKQLTQLTQCDVTSQMSVVQSQSEMQSVTEERTEVTQNQYEVIEEEPTQPIEEEQLTNGEEFTEKPTIEEVVETKISLTQEEFEKLRKEEEEMLEEQRRMEKQKKEMMEQMKLEQESRQVKQRSTPRVGKPKQVFGSPTPVARPLVLPGGRRWRKPEDAYNEAFFTEALSAQAELIQGTTKGINFMKYEKPPVSLDHLQNSETYKLIHNMEQAPGKRVELLTPVIAECDYREKCRSVTPTSMLTQQVQP